MRCKACNSLLEHSSMLFDNELCKVCLFISLCAANEGVEVSDLDKEDDNREAG